MLQTTLGAITQLDSWPLAISGEAASCSVLDPTCPLHDGIYALIRYLAAFLWAINRILLLLAYQVDVIRIWIVEEGLRGAFGIVIGEVELPLRGVVLLALWVFGICYFLIPWVNVRLVDIRRVLSYLLVASVLIQSGGEWLASLERVRGGLGAALLTSARRLDGPQLVATRDGEMAAMDQPIYDGAANAVCATNGLAQRQHGERHADDLAARFLFADAVDIHCPARRMPADQLPDGFYENGRYFVEDGLSALSEPERQARIQLGLDGVTRQAQGLLPALAAALEMAINLLFALALATTWLSIPIALLFAFFLHTEGIFGALVRRLAQIFIQSWTISVLLGIALALLMAAADAGSVGGYLAAALVCVGLMIAFALAAVRSLGDALDTTALSVGQATGLALPRPSAAFQTAARVLGGLGEQRQHPARAGVLASAGRPEQQRAVSAPLSPGITLRAGEVAAAMARAHTEHSTTAHGPQKGA
jgi:hypothetical protein